MEGGGRKRRGRGEKDVEEGGRKGWREGRRKRRGKT